jgi:N-terminal domain of (some) glycogen debranching enzymes
MNNLNRLRPMPSHLILHHGQAFMISNLAGLCGSGAEGFYYRQTRFLSKMRFTVEGDEPSSVCAVTINSNSAIAYFNAPTPAGAPAGPQPGQEGSSSEVVKKGIEIQINRLFGECLHHEILVTNRALAPANVVLRWELDADFADHSEAKQGERQQDAPVERSWRSSDAGAILELRYCHPQLKHATEIRLSGLGDLTEEEGEIAWRLQLSPQRQVSLFLDVTPIFCNEPAPAGQEFDPFGAARPEKPSPTAFS